jgi:outer membrane biosynthesis protein TonB
MKRLSSLFILLILCASAYSQGLKIIRYVVPPYPPTAKAVGADGEVQILAALDKDGNVISVDGISGHPLLRQASKEAALKWVFEKELYARNSQVADHCFLFWRRDGTGSWKK